MPDSLHLAGDSQHDGSYHYWSVMSTAGQLAHHPRLRASCEPVIEPLMHGSAGDAAGLVGRGGGSGRDCCSTRRVSAPISTGVCYPPLRTCVLQRLPWPRRATLPLQLRAAALHGVCPVTLSTAGQLRTPCTGLSMAV